MISAVAEKRLDDRYRVTLENLTQERESLAQQIGASQQQLQQQGKEAQDFQAQVHEFYRAEAQKAVETIVAQAKAREAEIIAKTHLGAIDPCHTAAVVPNAHRSQRSSTIQRELQG